MTTSKDSLSQEDFDLLREALEASFQDMAKAHEAQLSKAVAAWQAADGAEPGDERNQKLMQAAHHSRVGDALKAMMWVRYPAGSLDWFGRDEE